jgi:hypothetical protein
LGLDEFISLFGQEARPGFTKAAVSAWRSTLEACGPGSVSINVRITAFRKVAVEAADNGLLAPKRSVGGWILNDESDPEARSFPSCPIPRTHRC